jgi:hypothetical protein
MKKIITIITFIFLLNTCLLLAVNNKEVLFCAKYEVSNNLIAPSTASIVSAKILEKKNSWYIIYVVVDSQNSFGAYIRGGFLCCIKPLGNKRYQTTRNGTQSIERESPSGYFLSLYKSTIYWDTLK